jgi:acyl carrier protein phosphodiesterase
LNYLAHLYLSDGTDESLVGSLLGDFVKGDDHNGYSEGIRRAILIHRRIDTFTDAHPVHRRSRGRLSDSHRHTRGILVDIFYDHFLAKNWDQYADETLPDFTNRVYRILEERQDILPPRLRKILPWMAADNWLLSYRDTANIGHALRGLSFRLQRENELAKGLDELEQNYAELEDDFQEFFPHLTDHVQSLRLAG